MFAVVIKPSADLQLGQGVSGKHPPQTWAGLVEGWRDLGVAYLGVNTMGAGFTSPDEHLEAIRRWKDETGL